MTEKISPTVLEFLDHSNKIERVHGLEALEDAIKAWEYFKEHDYLFDSIMWCHYLLMRRLNPSIAGKLRECDVWIGGSRKRFVSEVLLKGEIDFLCDRIQVSEEINILVSDIDKEKKTKELHVKFEDIHPFVDGNGRVGRILYNVHRLRLGLPIHIIHEGEEQQDYYKWFK